MRRHRAAFALLCLGLLLLLGGLSLGGYWVFLKLLESGGWGSSYGEEGSIALLGAGALALVVLGALLLTRGLSLRRAS